MRRRDYLKWAGVTGTATIAGCAGNQSDDSDGGGGESDGGSTPTDDGGSTGTTSSDPIVIAGIEPLSGPFTPWGNAHVQGLRFGINEINGNGGVLDGRNLELSVADTGGDPANADSEFRRLVEQNNAVVATGPVSSDVGIRTAQTAENLAVPLFMHMTSSDDVLTSDTTHAFRVGLPPASLIMEAQSRMAENQDVQSVGAIVADYAAGHSVADALRERFPMEKHIQVAPVGASDFASYIRQLPSEMDMFVATGHPPGQLTIISQMNELNVSADLITGAGYPLSVLVDALGDLAGAANGLAQYHMHSVSSDEFKETASSYYEATDEYMSPNDAYGYITANVVADAVENAGSTDPEAITEAIKSNEYDTLFPQPLKWSDHGEFVDQRQSYSFINLSTPDFLPSGSVNYHLERFFQTEPLPTFSHEG